MQKNKKLLNLYPFNICTQLKHENFGVGYKSENRKFKNLLIFWKLQTMKMFIYSLLKCLYFLNTEKIKLHVYVERNNFEKMFC